MFPRMFVHLLNCLEVLNFHNIAIKIRIFRIINSQGNRLISNKAKMQTGFS